jgi:hypothetical protein
MIEGRGVFCLVFLNPFSVSASCRVFAFRNLPVSSDLFKVHADARSQNAYLLEIIFSLILSIGKALGTNKPSNKPFDGINNAIVPAFHVDGFGIT